MPYEIPGKKEKNKTFKNESYPKKDHKTDNTSIEDEEILQLHPESDLDVNKGDSMTTTTKQNDIDKFI